MRSVLYFLSAALVIGLAYWAYQQNFQTQQALKRVTKLQAEIAATRETLSVQRAEWAYLNRPDRLRDLVEMSYGDLELLPMNPGHFGEIEQVTFPPAPGLQQGVSASGSNDSAVDPE